MPSPRPSCAGWLNRVSPATSTNVYRRLLAVEEAERETLLQIVEGGGR
jgi:hypothetical protein